jgi:hypothetical protein
MIALVYAKPCGRVNTLFRVNIPALTLFSLPAKAAPVLGLAGSVELLASTPATDLRQGARTRKTSKFGFARPLARINTLLRPSSLTSLNFLASEFIPVREAFRKNSYPHIMLRM